MSPHHHLACYTGGSFISISVTENDHFYPVRTNQELNETVLKFCRNEKRRGRRKGDFTIFKLGKNMGENKIFLRFLNFQGKIYLIGPGKFNLLFQEKIYKNGEQCWKMYGNLSKLYDQC
jgi:hypothetical protein